MSMLNEFKSFALKGNVMDMAIGIIIGSAFGKIVQSLVKDIIMPVVGYAVGGVDFSDLAYVLAEKTESAEAVLVKYGQFIQTTVDFLIVAAAIFVAVQVMNKLKKKEEAIEESAQPKGPTTEELLVEIRDSLKK
jgi:large conductance mechanosensitive channel